MLVYDVKSRWDVEKVVKKVGNVAIVIGVATLEAAE